MTRELQLEALLARLWRRESNAALRLARLVHDGISQQVTALKIGLATLRNRASRDAPNLVADLDELRGLAGELMGNATHLVDESYPPILESLGLAAAVRWKANRFQQELGIPVRCQLDDVQLPAEVSALLFHILIEGLANVQQHAQATSVDILRERSGGTVKLTLADNGQGFDAKQSKASLGLLELRARAARAGGAVTVKSHPGQGARLAAAIPVDAAASSAPATQTGEPIHVLMADDHPIVRRGLRQVLEEQAGMKVDEVASFPALREYLSKRCPDVLLLDINMPGGNGLEMVGELKRNYPRLPVLVLSVHPEEQAGVRAMLSGAKGYQSKGTEPENLVEAVQRLHQGGWSVSPYLSEALAGYLQQNRSSRPPHHSLSGRELTVLTFIATGKTTPQIAAQMNLSPKTVGTYRARIIEKMGIRSTAELTRYAIENGLMGGTA